MIKKGYLVLSIQILWIIILGKIVFAYINPGTGSAVAGTLWPLIIVFFSTIGAFLIKHFWSPIKRFFSKDNKKKKE